MLDPSVYDAMILDGVVLCYL